MPEAALGFSDRHRPFQAHSMTGWATRPAIGRIHAARLLSRRCATVTWWRGSAARSRRHLPHRDRGTAPGGRRTAAPGGACIPLRLEGKASRSPRISIGGAMAVPRRQGQPPLHRRSRPLCRQACRPRPLAHRGAQGRVPVSEPWADPWRCGKMTSPRPNGTLGGPCQQRMEPFLPTRWRLRWRCLRLEVPRGRGGNHFPHILPSIAAESPDAPEPADEAGDLGDALGIVRGDPPSPSWSEFSKPTRTSPPRAAAVTSRPSPRGRSADIQGASRSWNAQEVEKGSGLDDLAGRQIAAEHEEHALHRAGMTPAARSDWTAAPRRACRGSPAARSRPPPARPKKSAPPPGRRPRHELAQRQRHSIRQHRKPPDRRHLLGRVYRPQPRSSPGERARPPPRLPHGVDEAAIDAGLQRMRPTASRAWRWMAVAPASGRRPPSAATSPGDIGNADDPPSPPHAVRGHHDPQGRSRSGRMGNEIALVRCRHVDTW
jgi:hypothetical protein